MSPADLAELVGAFNTVTARLQATHDALHAEVRQLKAELEEANAQVERSRRLAALGEMAAGISHEVRNPLGSIRLYAKILRDDLGDRPDSRLVAEKIMGAVSRLDAVVGDVLTFSRELKPRATWVDAGELLAASLDSARGEGAAWAGVSVRGPIVEPAGLSVWCDPNLVQQALVNLIRNAAEAMAELPEGRPRGLTLEARSVRRVQGEGAQTQRVSMVSLMVKDTGPGIPAEVMERMFNPFFTTRATGTGLGLAIVHRLADAHGGRVSVKNARAGGAIVELLLPRATEQS
jgi:signal transduction histidine kinase